MQITQEIRNPLRLQSAGFCRYFFLKLHFSGKNGLFVIRIAFQETSYLPSTIDRIKVISGIRHYHLHLKAAWHRHWLRPATIYFSFASRLLVIDTRERTSLSLHSQDSRVHNFEFEIMPWTSCPVILLFRARLPMFLQTKNRLRAKRCRNILLLWEGRKYSLTRFTLVIFNDILTLQKLDDW